MLRWFASCGTKTMCFSIDAHKIVNNFMIFLSLLTIKFSADGNFEVTLTTKATIYSKGLVEWQPPAIYKVGSSLGFNFKIYCNLGHWFSIGSDKIVFICWAVNLF